MQKRIHAFIMNAVSNSTVPQRILVVVSGVPPQWIELGSGVTTAFLAAAVDSPTSHTVIVAHDGRHCFTRCKHMYETFIAHRYALDSMECGGGYGTNHIAWHPNTTGPATVKRCTFVNVFTMMPLIGAMPLADLPFNLDPALMTFNLRGVGSVAAQTPYLWPNTTHLNLVTLGRKLADPTNPLSQHTHVTSAVSHDAPSDALVQEWTDAGWTVVNMPPRIKIEVAH